MFSRLFLCTENEVLADIFFARGASVQVNHQLAVHAHGLAPWRDVDEAHRVHAGVDVSELGREFRLIEF